jgi:hypothetical protein
MLVPAMKEVVSYMCFVKDRSSAESVYEAMKSISTEAWHRNHLHAAGSCVLSLLRRLKDEQASILLSQELAQLLPDASVIPIETKQVICRESLLSAAKLGSIDAIQHGLALARSWFSSQEHYRHLRYVMNPTIVDHISIALMRGGFALEADQLTRMRAPSTESSVPEELDFTYSLPILRAMTLESAKQVSTAAEVLYKSLGEHASTPIDLAMLSYRAKLGDSQSVSFLKLYLLGLGANSNPFLVQIAEMVNHLQLSSSDEMTAQITASVLMSDAFDRGSFDRLQVVFDDLTSRFPPNPHVLSTFLEKVMKRPGMMKLCLLFYGAWVLPVLSETGDAQLYNSAIMLFSRLHNPVEALRLVYEAKSKGLDLPASTFSRIFSLFADVGDLPSLMKMVLEFSDEANFEMNSKVIDLVLMALHNTRDYSLRLGTFTNRMRAELSDTIEVSMSVTSFSSVLQEKIAQERPEFLAPRQFLPEHWMHAFTKPEHNPFYQLSPERRDKVAWELTRVIKQEFEIRLTSRTIASLAKFVSTPQQLLDFVANDIILESTMIGSNLRLEQAFAHALLFRVRHNLFPTRDSFIYIFLCF